MNSEQRREIVDLALAARKNAYAVYSKYHVGAAVLTTQGRVFAGCNVENASYGLTVCAERVAVYNAVTEGENSFAALAVATADAAAPCGACRQVLAEYCDELTILLVDARDTNSVREVRLSELFPERFDRK